MTSEYDLNQSISHYTSGHVLLMEYAAESVAFAVGDVNAANNEITLAGATFVEKTRVRVAGIAGVDPNQILFCLNGTSPYQFSETVGGDPVEINSASSGTVTDAEPVDESETGSTRQVQSVADAVRYEANYQGVGNRPIINYGNASIEAGKATLAYADNEATLNNTAGANDLTFGYAVLIKGGLNAPGDTTGDVQAAVKYPAQQIVAVGEVRKLQFQITAEGV